MKRAAVFALGCALALLAAGPAPSAATKDADAAFQAFWSAHSVQDAARLARDVVDSGVTFDEALKRLTAGRSYSASVPKGVVKSSYRARSREFFYSVNVPDSYDPAKRYQVRFQLHGGVSRPSNQPRGNGSIGALAGAEQIYVLPNGWAGAEWWTDVQLENLGVILDAVKRTYNVDENRVVLSGVSDGGTGAYYVAMHDTTPFASFLPLNGFIMVLDSVDGSGDEFPHNLLNKPMFAVNGGMDPLYPTRIVTPYVEHLKQGGVAIEYHPQPNAVHNTAWWPEMKDPFEAFVRSHPRTPLPDRLTWETGGAAYDNRAHWLVINKLASRNRSDAPLDDVNRTGERGQVLFEHRHPSGRVDLVRSGNVVKATTRGVAEFTLLLSPETFDFSKPVRVETNGHVAFDGPVEKSLSTLLTWAARDNDRTMLFGAELHVTVR